jgi:riboflavin transporter
MEVQAFEKRQTSNVYLSMLLFSPHLILDEGIFCFGMFFEPILFSRDESKKERGTMNQVKSTKKLVTLGMLSSISYLLMMLNFPLPGLPPFLKIDFSEVPALIAAIIYGPVAGIIVEAIKNALHYLVQGSMTGVPVGQAANFVAGLLYILPAAYLFRKFRNAKGITWGLVAGTVTMTLLMSVTNYYVWLPAYTLFLQAPALSGEDARQLIVTGIMPFNMVKGILTGVIFALLFAKMKRWFNEQTAY